MKRTLILSLIACGASVALCPGLYAQDAAPAPVTTGTVGGAGGGWQHHGPGGGDMVTRLTTELGLSPDQVEKLKPILVQLHSDMQAIQQDASLQPADKMAKRKLTRDAANDQIMAILTPDQQAKFQAMRDKARARHAGAEAGGSPAAAPSTSGS